MSRITVSDEEKAIARLYEAKQGSRPEFTRAHSASELETLFEKKDFNWTDRRRSSAV